MELPDPGLKGIPLCSQCICLGQHADDPNVYPLGPKHADLVHDNIRRWLSALQSLPVSSELSRSINGNAHRRIVLLEKLHVLVRDESAVSLQRRRARLLKAHRQDLFNDLQRSQ